MKRREAGETYVAIATALGVSKFQVQTVIGLAKPERPFVPTERDPDFNHVRELHELGLSKAAIYKRYAAQAPRPYILRRLFARYELWQSAQEREKIDISAKQEAPSPSQIVTKTADSALLRRNRDALGPASSPPHDKAKQPSIAKPDLRTAPARGSRALYHSPANSVNALDIVKGAPLDRGLLWITATGAALQIRRGALCLWEGGQERLFPRGRHAVKTIVVNSPGASITVEALRFCIAENVALFVMHRAGEGLALLTDAPTLKDDAYSLARRRLQFGLSDKERVEVARSILRLKIEACNLDEVTQSDAARDIGKAKNVVELLTAEGRVARAYWDRWNGATIKITDRAPPHWAVFRGRIAKVDNKFTPRYARTPHNAALNYVYAVTLGNVTRLLSVLASTPHSASYITG